jgi:peptide/nickel transport system substrate-binding protein
MTLTSGPRCDVAGRDLTMSRGARGHGLMSIGAAVALVIAAAATVQGAEAPRRGGILLAAIAAEPPSLDPHQEATFANIQMVAPCYSTLLQFDPQSFPKIIGDVATEWKVSPDGRTYTFKIRPGIRFHDGSALTSADVKASYDKIVFPPAGVRSTRKTGYSAIERIEAPDPGTVVFRLKFPPPCSPTSPRRGT